LDTAATEDERTVLIQSSSSSSSGRLLNTASTLQMEIGLSATPYSIISQKTMSFTGTNYMLHEIQTQCTFHKNTIRLLWNTLMKVKRKSDSSM